MPDIKIRFYHEPEFGLMLSLSEAVSKCLREMETPLEGVSEIFVFQTPSEVWKMKIRGESMTYPHFSPNFLIIIFPFIMIIFGEFDVKT